jgi:hypothetical protein
LKRAQGGSLTAQRSYGAISAHIFDNNLPIYEHALFSPRLHQSGHICSTTIFDWLLRLRVSAGWFPKSLGSTQALSG